LLGTHLLSNQHHTNSNQNHTNRQLRLLFCSVASATSSVTSLPHAAEIAYGLLSILLITPLLGLLVAQLPLNPRPLALGLALVCTMPTALACGVAFVQVR
jgi:predicted Na+-dependent transporter